MDMKGELLKQFGKEIRKIYFIGIGGSSMHGLAEMAVMQGFTVEGSDMKDSQYAENLRALGATVYIGQKAENLSDSIDLVVYTAAIRAENPEMIRAKELNLPLAERATYLGFLSHIYPETTGISGTHGKTTTSAMVAELLTNDGRRPCVSTGDRHAWSDGEHLVIESCEYVDSFLRTTHNVGIITNIEEDHLDYFKGGLPQIKESFHKFAAIIPDSGILIYWGDSRDVLDVTEGLTCHLLSFGLNAGNDLQAANVVYSESGCASFDVLYKGAYFDHFTLGVPGQHNVLNALAAIGVALYYGIHRDVVEKTLDGFRGANRRFQVVARKNDITIIEDYAHHPTELKVTVDCCRKLPYKKLWVVFQAHTYSRVYYFFNEFVDAFEGADRVILDEIYSDRESNQWNIYSKDVAAKVEEKFGIPSIVIHEFDDIVDYLKKNVEPGDLVLVAGSQTINKVAYLLADAIE